MSKKVSFISLLVFLIAFLSIKADLVKAQGLNAALPDLTGAPGKRVAVNISLADSNTVAQSGINICFNPNVAFIQDIGIDVTEGAALEGTDFFIVPAVKDIKMTSSSTDCVNVLTMGVFIGVFPSVFPPPIIPDGDIITMIFTINSEAQVGDSTDLVFSLDTFNATSFSDINTMVIPVDQSNFTNGSITVVKRPSGGGGCAMASGSVNGGQAIAALLIMLIPTSVVGLRRLKRKGNKK